MHLLAIILLSGSFIVPAESFRVQAKGQAAEGEKVFLNKCASCHAKEGSGDTAMGKKLKAADLRSETVQKKADTELPLAMMKVKAHPDFRKLIGDEGLLDVVAYLRTLKVAPAPKTN